MQRTIDLDGCVNFRDLGGYRSRDGRALRWRAVFRSDSLHDLSAADVAMLRDQMNLGTIVDLRTRWEIDADGRGPLGGEAVLYHHVPIFDEDPRAAPGSTQPDRPPLLELYKSWIDDRAERIGSAIEQVASAPAAAVFHCAAGKDRTGVIAAFLLGALDVPEETIVADYALSGERMAAIIERVSKMSGYEQTMSSVPRRSRGANAETMRALLGFVAERHGGIPRYLRSAGVSAETLRALRDRLLE